MGNELYVANLSPDTTETQLQELFGQYDDVAQIHLGVEEKTGETFAIVALSSEKIATRANRELNGYEFNARRLAVSYPDIEPRDLTAKQRKLLDEVLETLEETDQIPQRQIEAIARLCGMFFVQALVEETMALNQSHGLMTSDGSRQRTKGGIFFYLTRYRLSPAVRRIVFNRKGKIP